MFGSSSAELDIGPSTITVVTNITVRLILFAEEFGDYQPKIRRLQEKLACQRRAANPNNYNDDRIVKKGVRRWKKSNRQVKTRTKTAKIKRKQTAGRRSAH